jgi:ribosome assembly protein 4
MSVLFPPPKRQKVYHGVPEPEGPQISDESVPNVVVQFINDQDGSPLAPAVNLPANVPKDALEALVNKLRPQVSLHPTYPCLPALISFFASFR